MSVIAEAERLVFSLSEKDRAELVGRYFDLADVR